MTDATRFVQGQYMNTDSGKPGEPFQVTIKSCHEQEFERDNTSNLVLSFHEHEQQLVLNKTRARTMISLFGPQTGAWLNQRIELSWVPSSIKGRCTIGIRRVAAAPAAQPTNGQPQNGQPVKQAQPPVHTEVSFQ